jgi:hypothetical protein
MPIVRIRVRNLRNDDELDVPGYGTIRFLGWESPVPGSVGGRLTFKAVTEDGREVHPELHADYYFDVVRAPEVLVPTPLYTVEDALAEVAEVVRGYEETGSVQALLAAAKRADERYQGSGSAQEPAARLARTLLIALWALHAGPLAHPEEEFEFEAYGFAG